MFTLVQKSNVGELDEIIRLAAALRFDHVNLIEPIFVDEVAESQALPVRELQGVDFVRLARLAKAHGMRLSTNNVRRRRTPPAATIRCLQPWDYVFIRANGDVQPCCAVFGEDRAAIMGNVFRDEFTDIWNGERFTRFRRSSAQGTNALCNACPSY